MANCCLFQKKKKLILDKHNLSVDRNADRCMALMWCSHTDQRRRRCLAPKQSSSSGTGCCSQPLSSSHRCVRPFKVLLSSFSSPSAPAHGFSLSRRFGQDWNNPSPFISLVSIVFGVKLFFVCWPGTFLCVCFPVAFSSHSHVECVCQANSRTMLSFFQKCTLFLILFSFSLFN